jgi:hypothetical protein
MPLSRITPLTVLTCDATLCPRMLPPCDVTKKMMLLALTLLDGLTMPFVRPQVVPLCHAAWKFLDIPVPISKSRNIPEVVIVRRGQVGFREFGKGGSIG